MKPTETRKFVDTETTVGTKLEEAASKARENTVSMYTVAAANPEPAINLTIQHITSGGDSTTRPASV